MGGVEQPAGIIQKKRSGGLSPPLPELWGTLVWGLAAGAVAYTARSIWPVTVSHWLLNVFMDGLIVGMF